MFSRLPLCDLVGFTQTVAAHQAAKKFFHFDSEYDVENTERYLWALSIGTNPQVILSPQLGSLNISHNKVKILFPLIFVNQFCFQEEVIYDILKLSENTNLPPKLTETMVLTVSAMANKYSQQSRYGFRTKVSFYNANLLNMQHAILFPVLSL